MISYSKLPNRKKMPDETWREFTIRYNAMIDALNSQMRPDEEPYSRLSCIIFYDE